MREAAVTAASLIDITDISTKNLAIHHLIG